MRVRTANVSIPELMQSISYPFSKVYIHVAFFNYAIEIISQSSGLSHCSAFRRYSNTNADATDTL